MIFDQMFFLTVLLNQEVHILTLSIRI